MKLSLEIFKAKWLRSYWGSIFQRTEWIKYAVIGLGLYLLFLLVSVPASWLSWALTKYSDGTIAITQPSGSIWSGKGNVVINYSRSRPQDFGLTRWSINPFWLFTGRVRLRLEGLDNTIKGQTILQRTISTTSLLNSRLSLPATVVSSIYAPAALFAPSGRVEISTDTLSLNEDGLQGKLELQWLDAGSAMSPVQPLGDYRLTLEGKGDTANIQLETVKGSLELIGKGNWRISGSGIVNFNGTAKPLNQAPELDPLLKLMGRDMGAGRRLIKFNARMPLLQAKQKKK